MSAEKARDAAATQAFERNVSMWRQETAAHAREIERRVADDRRAAEQSAQIQRRAAERAIEQRQHGIGHHGIVNYALQSAALAVSAHEVVNVGREAWQQGAELQHERLGLRNAGRTPQEMREIERAARGVVGSIPTGGVTESLKTIAETTAAFGSVEHAVANLPFITKATSVLKAAGGDNIHGDAASLGRAFAKTFEERQTRPQDFEREAKAMIPAMVATGGTFNPEQLYAFAQQAKSALPSLSMRFLSRIAPSLIGAQGGERAGTGLNAFENVISGKVNDKKQAEMFLKMGLLDPSKVIMKAGHAVGWQSGAVKDTKLAMTDPLAWTERYVIPAMKDILKIDPSDREAVQMVLNTMYRNQNANMFASELAQEASRARLHKDEDLYGRVGNFDEIYARNLQDFGVAAGALKTALGNLGAAVTAPLMTRVSGGLITLTEGINGVAAAALAHPTMAGAAGIGAGVVGLGGAGVAAATLYNGFGLRGSAAALDGAAAHLMEVGGTGGFGKGAGAAAAGVEAGVPALAIPGAVEAGAGLAVIGGAAALAGLVKASAAAQQPGAGGQYAPATPPTESADRLRLADQQAEAGRLQTEIARNERVSRIPGGADVVNLPLRDQLANVTSQIALLQGSLHTMFVSPDREADRGRAMAELASRRPPEEFGPYLPEADSQRTFGAYVNYARGRVGSGGSMPGAIPPPRSGVPGPDDAPHVDTSGLDAAKAKAGEVHAALDSLNTSVTPSVNMAALDALIAKAREAQAAIAAIGSSGGAASAGAIRAASNRQFAGASRVG